MAEADPELDELLDSALEDFDALKANPEVQADLTDPRNYETDVKENTTKEEASRPPTAVELEAFNQELFAGLEGLSDGNPMVSEMLKELANIAGGAGAAGIGAGTGVGTGAGTGAAEYKAGNKVTRDPTSDIADCAINEKPSANKVPNPEHSDTGDVDPFAAQMQRAMQQMAENAENTLNGDQPTGEDADAEMLEAMMKDLMKDFEEGIGLDDGDFDDAGEGEEDIMAGMMESLLSKELLYPSLTEVAKKYPGYLEENKGKLKAEEIKNYAKQHEVLTRIVKAYETDKSNKEQIQDVIALMEEMQQYGPPPAELVKSIDGGEGGGMPFGMMPGAGGSENCSLM